VVVHGHEPTLSAMMVEAVRDHFMGCILPFYFYPIR